MNSGNSRSGSISTSGGGARVDSPITIAETPGARADSPSHNNTTNTSYTPASMTSKSNSIGRRPTPTPSTISSSSIDAEEHQRRQNRKVCIIRVILITTLLTATAVVASFTGSYIAADERSNFEVQYYDAIAKVAKAFQHRIDTKHDTSETFSAMITSRYGNVAQAAMGREPLWPNVTIPDFQEQTAASLAIADGRALSFNPIITQDVNRLEWEAHAAESAWILGSPKLMTPSPDSTWPNNRTVAFGIYSRDSSGQVVYDPGYAPTSEYYENVMVPVWQIAPILTNEKAVMFNLHAERNRQMALDHMLRYKVPALTAILQLVQDVEIRPSSILFYPVFDTFTSETKPGSHSHNEGEDEENNIFTGDDSNSTNNNGEQQEQPSSKRNNVVGSVSIVFSWDALLNKILPDYIKGMVCVLQSSTGQTYSYTISGDVVTFLGEGDHHNIKYDEYGHHVQAKLVHKETEQEFITYMLHMYPSEEFEAQYITRRAGIYAGGVVLIFLFTSCLFLLFDYLVEDRQKRTVRLARQTGNIVDSMFPAAFRERLYKIHGNGPDNGSGIAGANNDPDRRRSSHNSCLDSGGGGGGLGSDRRSSVSSATSTAIDEYEAKSTTSSHASLKSSISLPKPKLGGVRRSSTMGSGALKQINKFMKDRSIGATSNDHNPLLAQRMDDEPIAELFHDTSIMFSDIVGFTKWSSERSPNEVFRLLEQIFWEFDDIALRLNVFKLGTIGDCYIAVTGIPNPIEDHAVVLTRFAFEARDKVRQVCARLESEGLDTAKLDMRFGMHSGDTTAGILRGTKSRFELFGDTINTASRMESTGLAGKIQISEETAELLRGARKSQWLSKRDTMIAAKGKGQLQTYWVEPQRKRVSFSEKITDSFLADVSNRSSDRLSECGFGGGSQLLSQWDEEKLEEEDISSHFNSHDMIAVKVMPMNGSNDVGIARMDMSADENDVGIALNGNDHGTARMDIAADENDVGIARNQNNDVGIAMLDMSADENDVGIGRNGNNDVGIVRMDMTADENDVGIARRDMAQDENDVGIARMDIYADENDVGIARVDMAQDENV